MRRSKQHANNLKTFAVFLILSSPEFFLSRIHRATASTLALDTGFTSTSPPATKDAARVEINSSSCWSDSLVDSNNQDRYVAASALSVAAVCSDGIALVSLHFSDYLNTEHSDGGNSRSAPNMSATKTDTSSDEKAESIKDVLSRFCDLPMTSRGPLRIDPIYESDNEVQFPPPMSLLTAGWRTDGMALADAARELMMEEVRLYCLPPCTYFESAQRRLEGRQATEILQYNSNTHVEMKRHGKPDNVDNSRKRQPYYGQRIAKGLSYYLSKCAHSLSCIGLLACGSGRRANGGSLHLVDAMGSHLVRAHAIGNGSHSLNRGLAQIDFEKMDCHEGLRVLMRLIAEDKGLVTSTAATLSEENDQLKGSVDAGNDKSLEDGSSDSKPIISTPPSLDERHTPHLAELAVLKSGEGRMRRVRLSSLLMATKSK